ncbi:hypothetical protein MTY66_53390 [Mycolicibacterium sp. TY66]|uniref:DUF6262 family protein n=1 Tax=unclassified Mycolicibacterium TaxID=2636767 RepID=UPI001BB3D474|nr:MULTISPECIES: DUF6262 family protein [unclassified Mycolicibacterium]BCI83714.1 hypothetical protein MTY66_53390 [Mycolicibacterium sp. TY66]BCJ78645.1 hypothetical protein MTY81_00180 [Mycolicibacterium sp. TY81]
MTQRSGPPTAAIAARKSDSSRKLASVEQALKRLLKQKVTEIDKSHLAALAGCSRTFLYQNQDARKLIMQAESRMKASMLRDAPASGAVDEANWRERALFAEQQLREARAKNISLSRTVADLLGQLRDPDGTWIEDDREKLRQQNETLRAALAAERLARSDAERRLGASRSNVRHLRQREADKLLNGVNEKPDW